MRRVATIASIVEGHVEDAAFLWTRRRGEIDGPLLDETEIGRIDQRLEANLEGLDASGLAGWAVAKARLTDFADAGELFVVGAIAMRAGSREAVAEALSLAVPMGERGVSALSGAVARTPREDLRPFVADWLYSRDARQRSLALAALSHHRADPGDHLADLLRDPDAGVRIRALRFTGRLKRVQHAQQVADRLQGENANERLAAAEALCLLGEQRVAWPAIDRIAQTEPELCRGAIELRLLTTPAGEAKRWLGARLDQPLSRLAAVASVGLLGDRSVMPWLIEKMRDPETVSAAGEALRDLFGVDFDETDTFTTDPETLGPAFAASEEPSLPVADKVAAWWDGGRGGKAHRSFTSMRRLRLETLRRAFAEPDLLPANWRRTRRFPAWS